MKQPTSLHVVRSLRLRHQDAAEQALAEALRSMRSAQQLLDALQSDLLRLKSCSAAPQGDLLHIADLLFKAQRIQALEHSCNEAKKVLDGHKAVMTERQGRYLEARKEREAVDALLKQRATQLEERQRRHDVKVADDLFLGRFHRAEPDAATAL